MLDQGQAIAQIRVEIDPKQPTNKRRIKEHMVQRFGELLREGGADKC